MAQNMDHGYFAKIVTRGSAWTLRVNDIHIRENVKVGYGNSTGNIGWAVKPGLNSLSLFFSPLTGKNPTTGEYEQSLHEGVSFEVTIERLDYKTRESLEVNALHISYNEGKGKFVNHPKTSFGQERKMRYPQIWSDGKYTVSADQTESLVPVNGQALDAYRLDVEFFVEDDQLWPEHWEDEAVPLEDTPEMRRELWGAYQELHALFQSGDTEEFFRRMEPIWAKAAHVYTMDLKSARDFVNDMSEGLDGFKPVTPSGEVLQPLLLMSDLENAAVQLFANNRLAWIRPNPIRWKTPDVEEYSNVPVVFYKTATGEWKIADINVGL
ncbi:hypothetical protein SCH4B_3585 [Ruegeria sp. TrichCH4B]|nr:hypothetical protein SCH4B_3585 [Ruegeria sp. TrichCH4B]